ncbi:serine decarboxylase 2 [Selaginella moellendorffii]|nr:serine decarboxylase 2 [Selaginella moellendorffii]|eukprot:XP_002989901.2 serine decarboxylase 2 [Selaginella moellendorffii]
MASSMSDLVPAQRVSSPTTNDYVYPALPKALEGVNFDLTSSLKDNKLQKPPPDHLQARKEALNKSLDYLKQQQSHFMGFQANQKMSFDELNDFLNVHLNNIGDPFVEGNCTTNTKFMERAVLDYYASLWNANWPHKSSLLGDEEGNSYWGFLLTMGSTEGNMYALWNARDYLGGKILLMESGGDTKKAAAARLVYRQAAVPPNAKPVPSQARSAAPFPECCDEFCENYFSPVAFYSEDTHYSFTKATRLIGIPTFGVVGEEKYPGMCPITEDGKWPDEVPSHEEGPEDGTIRTESLAELVLFFARRGHPIFVNLNYGTTFKGAYDSVVKAMAALMPIFQFYGHDKRVIDAGGEESVRTGFWIHVDGALGAAYIPYLKMAAEEGCKFEDGGAVEVAPEFDFSLEAVHSIAMSGHKWMGAPIPCGLFMSKRRYQINPPSNPIYTGTPDTTFAGSRNGLSAVFFWSYISKHTLKQQIDKAVRCQGMARFIYNTMTELGKKLNLDLWVARSPLSLTVRFRQLNDDLVFKYSLSNETLVVNDVQRLISHVFAMEHVTKELVLMLAEDVMKLGPKAFKDLSDGTAGASDGLTTMDAPLVSCVPFQGRGFSGN